MLQMSVHLHHVTIPKERNYRPDLFTTPEWTVRESMCRQIVFLYREYF